MATAPTVPNFAQYNFEVDDRTAVVTKQNGMNAALAQFGNSLATMTDSINQDLTTMGSLKSDTEAAAQSADQDAQQIALDKQAVADDRAHVDQQKQAIDTTAGEVSNNAQQVALDRQAVADDRQATAQAAVSADEDATAAQQAKTDAEALYGDLQAVDDAKTASQQAATEAGQERGQAETARQEAEQALSDTETVRDEAQQTVSQAITDHEAAPDPHGQYAKSAELGSAADKDTGTNAGEVPTNSDLRGLMYDVGDLRHVWDHLPGVSPPDNSGSAKWIKLTASENGAGGYNEGLLGDANVSGSSPSISATAEILVGPLAGTNVRLVNTERRFFRPGNSGALQEDEIKSHAHTLPDTRAVNTQVGAPGSSRFVGNASYDSTSAFGGAETRPRNVGETVYMLIQKPGA